MLQRLRKPNGPYIPVLLRLFHEHNGDWFWWSASTQREFVALWRFTVRYLRDQKHIHHVLYVYSPHFQGWGGYTYKFPGKAHVDVYGLDCYANRVQSCLPQLAKAAALARQDGKLAALTEVGIHNYEYPKYWMRYWTDSFLYPILKHPMVRNISYAMFWHNTGIPDLARRKRSGWNGKKRYTFAPYPGHPSVPNFIAMSRHPSVGFVPSRKVPVPVGPTSRYTWTGDQTQHVIFRDRLGHIHERFWNRKNKRWEQFNLTLLTGAAWAESSPVGVGRRNSLHIFFRKRNGRTGELYYSHSESRWLVFEVERQIKRPLHHIPKVHIGPHVVVEPTSQNIYLLYQDSSHKYHGLMYDRGWSYQPMPFLDSMFSFWNE